MRATEIAHLIALRMLHAEMLGRLRVVEQILEEAEAEHGHATAIMAYDEYMWQRDSVDDDDIDRAAALRSLVGEVMGGG
jgi:hypothetical protein